MRNNASQSYRGKGFVLLTCSVLLMGVVPTPSAPAASFMGLGYLPGGQSMSRAYGLSADGSVVVGQSDSERGPQAFRWTRDGGMVGLGDLPGGEFSSLAHGVSADGSTVVGMSTSTDGPQAFRWTSAGGMTGLGDLPGGIFDSRAYGVSGDGTVVVGLGNTDRGQQAFRWTSRQGMKELNTQADGQITTLATAVSADGSVVTGYGWFPPRSQGFRWTAGEGLVKLEGFRSVFGLSADGAVVVGMGKFGQGVEACRWTRDDGAKGIGDLPGGNFYSQAKGVSDDGQRVVGSGEPEDGQPRAFLWESKSGLKDLKSVLEQEYGLAKALNGWLLSEAVGISADGMTIVGYGFNPDGQTEAWLANLDPPTMPESAAHE